MAARKRVRSVAAGKREISVRGMTPEEFCNALDALNLNQTTAGYWLKMDRRSIHNYANGKQDVPLYLAKLLRLMIRLKLKPEDVA